MAACDVCRRHCKAADMTQLLSPYRSAGVEDVCPACDAWASERKNELLSEATQTLRAELRIRAGKPPLRKLWWKWR